ncbi:septal ring lytic transglycosylase RlpA family protein [Microvirga splendida]|uniref:Endolytic peptidoglycan transglycosylase RlpA n=1 Tax=Microvirga splendida TaxID=2795727 RepID=A0ABS0Y056_9HYPH|nr:septal ring lytic transglycosylase RlpA family protein [Microvirga splendida]MBJ6125697.1 septal ring lytic transglycosylase RlpA family protein [Microvirga splendida]
MRCNRAEGHTRLRGATLSLNQRTLLRVAGVTAIALMAANCSSNVRGGIDPKYGVAPSPKVVADGQPVPKGGGREMVGKPYTVAGRTYVPSAAQRPTEGLASWYGPSFHGRMTANGEVFDRASIAAAHTTMPLPSYARVTNLQNGHSMIVRVNDRGPFHGNRVIDVSERAAMALGFKQQGTARVRVEYVGRASTNGSDDRILMASLRTDGQPASLTNTAPTMIAQADPQPSAPRQAIALRSYQPAGQTYQASAPASQPAAMPRAVADNVPLPPERPFDLGTIPGAASPVARISSFDPGKAPASRPVVASLYETPASTDSSGFQRSGSAVAPAAQRFVLR